VRAEYNITSENELNAKVFDLLDHDLYICEVVPTIVYKNMSDVILEREPVDVGTYSSHTQSTARRTTATTSSTRGPPRLQAG
jgi:hypothetical protein